MPTPRIDPRTGDDLPVGVYISGSHYQYRIRVRDSLTGENRPEVRGGFLHATDAATAREKRLVETGQAPAAPFYARHTITEYLAEYLAGHTDIEASTARKLRQTGDAYIVPRIGHIRVVDLHQRQVAQWVRVVASEHGTAVANHARGLLSQMLRQAVRDDIVPRNVASLTKSVKHEPKPKVILQPEQIARFLTVADGDPDAALWYMALMTQLRPGELSALRWDAIDLDSGMLHVRAIRSTDVAGNVITKDRSKSRAGTRSFPLPDICVRLLRVHRAEQAAYRLRMPPGTWTDRGLVFPGRAGRILTQAAQSWRVTRMCERADVPVVTMHGLRHSGATWQLSIGVDAKLISQRLGHASVTFTLDSYVHPSDNDQRGVSERIEADLLRLRG